MSIYFLRSCETEWHCHDKLCGHADIPLSNAGRDCARIASDRLRDVSFDLIICSPLDRAHETARIVSGARDIPITFDTRIIERNCGDMEGTQPPHDYWDLNEDKEYPCAERLSDFIARINDFLQKTMKKYRDKNILIVSHGGVSLAADYYFNKTMTMLNPGECKEFFVTVEV